MVNSIPKPPSNDYIGNYLLWQHPGASPSKGFGKLFMDSGSICKTNSNLKHKEELTISLYVYSWFQYLNSWILS